MKNKKKSNCTSFLQLFTTLEYPCVTKRSSHSCNNNDDYNDAMYINDIELKIVDCLKKDVEKMRFSPTMFYQGRSVLSRTVRVTPPQPLCQPHRRAVFGN